LAYPNKLSLSWIISQLHPKILFGPAKQQIVLIKTGISLVLSTPKTIPSMVYFPAAELGEKSLLQVWVPFILL